MVRPIVRDVLFLRRKSLTADKNDLHIAKDLLDTLKANSETCVGMAANMIGELKCIMAVLDKNEYIVLINPVITDHSKKFYETEEGCLSLSGTRKTLRLEEITVEYYDKKFKKKRQNFKGVTAQIIQHEYDHFEGILI